jgi:hypothetical protein
MSKNRVLNDSLKRRRRKEVKEDPNLVAIGRFQAWWPMKKHFAWWLMESSNVWWPLEGEGEASFSLLFILSFNKFYLNLFFPSILRFFFTMVLNYYFSPFPPFP